jgi:hypothetical protein
LFINKLTLKVLPGFTAWLGADTLIVTGAVARTGTAVNTSTQQIAKNNAVTAVSLFFILNHHFSGFFFCFPLWRK